MNFNIVFFGVKDITKIIIDYLLDKGFKIDAVITVGNNKGNISGYENFVDYYKSKGIFVYEVDNYSLDSSRDLEFFQNNNFELGLSMGWQRLIPEQVLAFFKQGVFGFHGSTAYLPYGRGRSPLNWSILLGDKRFIINLFKYDKYADSPNVYSKVMWEINQHDNIRTMQYKNLIAAKQLLPKLINDYQTNNITINNKSNDFDFWYKKRGPNDGKIDFHLRTKDIYNLIRSVSKPFPGAFAFVESEKIIVWSATPFDNILDFSDYIPGQVIDIFDDKVIIRTLDGSLIIHEYESNIMLKKNMIFK